MHNQPQPTPSGSPAPGKGQKLINTLIAVLMVICAIARHYRLDSLADVSEAVKWVLDLIVLVLP